MDDQSFYNIVALELRHRLLKTGLWLRAVTETGGEGKEAQVRYIQLRVAELVQELERVRLMSKLQKQEEQEKKRMQEQIRHRRRRLVVQIAAGIVLAILIFSAIWKFSN